VIALLLLLYPAAWRRRYGEEFAAVLESRHLGPFDVFDVVLAAIDAHLHFRGRQRAPGRSRGFLMSSRIGGAAAIIGGVLLVIAMGWSIWDPADSDPGGFLVFPGLLAILIGLIGLSAFQARQHPGLIWVAFLVPAVGVVISVAGLIAGLLQGDRDLIADWGAWEFFVLGIVAVLLGSALFGYATWRTRALTRPGAALLAASSVVAVVAMFGGIFVALPAEIIIFGAMLGYGAGWVSLGWSALANKAPLPAVGA
jgi:hypothetical protein